MRKTLLSASLLLSFAIASPLAMARAPFVVDTHIDAPEQLMQHWVDLGTNTADRQFDGPKAHAGGLGVAFMSIYTSPAQDGDGTAWQVANQMIDSVEALAQRHPDQFALLVSPRDAERQVADGRVLLPLGMENAAPLGDKLGNVRFFFDRGVRYITLAHSANNRLADSSYALEKKWNGLSPFGREVVREMNRLGIMVDVSHLGDASAREAIALSTVPVIASHSAFRHFTPDFERNISDELARAIAAKGGVVQVPFGTAFIDPASAADTQAFFRASDDFDRRDAELRAQGKPGLDRARFDADWDAAHPPRKSTLAQVLDEIDYGVKLVGVDHVGIGSDFDGVDGHLPDELQTTADYPRLAAGLRARGYSDADIGKILGGNLLRTWAEIEAGANRE